MSKKRRGSPLQEWRSQYGYVSGQLRDIKRGIRSGEGWSNYARTSGALIARIPSWDNKAPYLGHQWANDD